MFKHFNHLLHCIVFLSFVALYNINNSTRGKHSSDLTLSDVRSEKAVSLELPKRGDRTVLQNKVLIDPVKIGRQKSRGMGYRVRLEKNVFHRSTKSAPTQSNE